MVPPGPGWTSRVLCVTWWRPAVRSVCVWSYVRLTVCTPLSILHWFICQWSLAGVSWNERCYIHSFYNSLSSTTSIHVYIYIYMGRWGGIQVQPSQGREGKGRGISMMRRDEGLPHRRMNIYIYRKIRPPASCTETCRSRWRHLMRTCDISRVEDKFSQLEIIFVFSVLNEVVVVVVVWLLAKPIMNQLPLEKTGRWARIIFTKLDVVSGSCVSLSSLFSIYSR